MNFIKKKVSENTTKGIFIVSGSGFVAEMASNSGFDWLILDLEHGSAVEKDALQMMRAMNGYQAAPIVRIPQLRIEYIKRMLDFGASGVMCPMIETDQEARELAEFMRYPPQGKRGLAGNTRAAAYGNNFKNYFSQANSELLCIAQIETGKAIDNIEKIAQVEGIDVLFIGHSDLSLSLGCFEQYEKPEIVEAENKVLAAAAKYGKITGMHMKQGMDFDKYTERGFSFMAVGSDSGCLGSGFKKLLK